MKVIGSRVLTPKTSAFASLLSAKADDESDSDSNAAQHGRLRKHESKQLRRRGAEGESNTEFVCALHDAESDDAVDSYASKK